MKIETYDKYVPYMVVTTKVLKHEPATGELARRKTKGIEGGNSQNLHLGYGLMEVKENSYG